MVLKTWRIAPGEANTWSMRVLGMKGSALLHHQIAAPMAVHAL